MDEPDRPIEKFILPADLPAYLYHFLEYFIGQSQHLPDTNIPDLSKFWHEHRFSFHPDSYEPSLRVHVKRLFTIIFLAINYSTVSTIQIKPHKIYKKQKNNRVIQTSLSRIFFHILRSTSILCVSLAPKTFPPSETRTGKTGKSRDYHRCIVAKLSKLKKKGPPFFLRASSIDL